MQIVNGVTAKRMLENGLSGDDIIRIGLLCGVSYFILSDIDKNYVNSLEKKGIYLLNDSIGKYELHITGYSYKPSYSGCFISSHLCVFSGNYQDNREYYYDNMGNKIILTVHKI